MSKYLRELLDKATSPAPAPAEAGGWTGPPVPLATLPPVPPFPLCTLPRALAAFVTAGAAALHTPMDFLAVLALALLGAASGRTRAARLKPGWCEFPALWVVVVALPGRVKSAALALVCRPLWTAERKWRQDHAAAVRSFAAEEAPGTSRRSRRGKPTVVPATRRWSRSSPCCGRCCWTSSPAKRWAAR